MKYLDYLKEAYIINGIKQYSTKLKRDLLFFEKIYDEDVSFNSIRKKDFDFDLTHNLENIVYNELIYQGYNITNYKLNDNEIDFKVSKNGKISFIQVAYSIVEAKTREREFKIFNQMDMSNKKIIITCDDLDFSTSTVKHINIKDFLLKDLEL